MNVGKVDIYTEIGDCRACAEVDESFYKVHITRSDHRNCAFLKERQEENPKHGEIIELDNGLILGWDEGVYSPTKEMLKRALELMDGKKVFIHCTAGRHRASMTTIAHLYHNSGYSFIDAICRTNAARKKYREQTVTALNPQELRLIKNLYKG